MFLLSTKKSVICLQLTDGVFFSFVSTVKSSRVKVDAEPAWTCLLSLEFNFKTEITFTMWEMLWKCIMVV